MRSSVLFFSIGVAVAAAQTFEVATIKPSAPGPTMTIGWFGGPGTKDPGMFRCQNCSPSLMIGLAFQLDDYRYSGPAWTDSVYFELSARVPEGATKAQFDEMFRSFLIERFQLKFHYEKEPGHGYDLVVAKGGPKFQPAPDSLEPTDDEKRPDPDFSKHDVDGFPALPPGRKDFMMAAHGLFSLRTAGGTMDGLAGQIATQLREPVTDSTGLTGKYDYTLKWSGRDPATATDSKPTMFKAVQDQLGLKLEPRKAMIDVFVVDHIDKNPIAN